MGRRTERPRTIKRVIDARLRRIERQVADDLMRARVDAGASIAQVARAPCIDRAHVGRIERGVAHASLESLVACAAAIGADVSIRIDPGVGPRLTDRHQAAMIEEILRHLNPIWRPHLEVSVSRPSRGVIDAVFERRDQPTLVVSEFQSTLPRLEQQLRWIGEKVAAIASSDLVGPRALPPVSKLLVLRSTEATREVARRFESILRTAYPAQTRAAVDSLRSGSPWPGDAIVWMRIEGTTVTVLDGPPRGVAVGR
jgi:transcriptional regulator with XRE-family HTH domain